MHTISYLINSVNYCLWIVHFVHLASINFAIKTFEETNINVVTLGGIGL